MAPCVPMLHTTRVQRSQEHKDLAHGLNKIESMYYEFTSASRTYYSTFCEQANHATGIACSNTMPSHILGTSSIALLGQALFDSSNNTRTLASSDPRTTSRRILWQHLSIHYIIHAYPKPSLQTATSVNTRAATPRSAFCMTPGPTGN